MRKYCPIDIEKYLNHKMILNGMTDEVDGGVLGVWICDKRFQFEKKEKYIQKVKCCLWGADAKLDNIRCHGQKIKLPDIVFSKIMLIGFSEVGSYYDEIKLIDANGFEQKVQLMFYHLTENTEMLYECDYSDKCKKAFSAKTNAMFEVHYFANVIEVSGKISYLVLQDNEEIHISAITLIR